MKDGWYRYEITNGMVYQHYLTGMQRSQQAAFEWIRTVKCDKNDNKSTNFFKININLTLILQVVKKGFNYLVFYLDSFSRARLV